MGRGKEDNKEGKKKGRREGGREEGEREKLKCQQNCKFNETTLSTVVTWYVFRSHQNKWMKTPGDHEQDKIG